MVIKVLISGISASKEIKKHQQRAQMLLDSLKVNYQIVDITEPGHEEEKELMKTVCKKRNGNPIAHPPQFFNEDQYCGDYEDLSNASDEDTVLSFLGLEEELTIENGDASSSEGKDIQIDSSVVTNGKESPTDGDIETEVSDEVVVVEERLTVNGKVIDIPPEKLLELKGHKINLKDLMSQTKVIEESRRQSVKSLSDSEKNRGEDKDVNKDEAMDDNEDNNDNNEDTNNSKDNVVETKDSEEPMEQNNDNEEKAKSSSEEEEEEDEEEEEESDQ